MKQAANLDRIPRTSFLWGMLCLALFITQCTSIERATRVAITLDAEPAVRERIAHVDLAFYTEISPNAWRMRAQERLRPEGERGWPLHWMFSREKPEEMRFSLEARALDAEAESVAELRAVAMFREHDTVTLKLTFDASCKQACAEGSTCSDGVCVDAEVMTTGTRADNAQPQSGSRSEPNRDGGSKANDSSTGPNACGADATACDDECGPDHGGCDPGVSCTLEQGKPRCGACRDGFEAQSDGSCSPLLRELAVEGAALEPSFRPEHNEYTLQTGLIAGQWSLKPTAAAGVTLTLDTQPLAAGAAVVPQLLAAGTEQVVIEVTGAAGQSQQYRVKLQARGEELAFLKAPTPAQDAHFGHRIALEGDTLAIAADGDDSSARGVNPDNPPRDGVTDSGAVHVFVRKGSSWQPQAYIKASDGSQDAGFGKCIAMQGNTLVVGAWKDADRGAVYIYERTGESWVETTKLLPDMQQETNFGQSVTLQGDLLIIGAPTYDYEGSDAGVIFVYRRNPADQSWTFERKVAAEQPMALTWFGSSVLLGGDYLVVGATGEANGSVASGTAYVLRSDNFELIDILKPAMASATGFFGERSAIAGDTVAITSFNNNAGLSSGSVYIYTRKADGKFELQSALQASNASAGDLFGFSVALTDDYLLVGAMHESSGTRGINGALSSPSVENSGAAYLFARTATGFNQIAHIKASEPAAGAQLGYDVAISGSDIAVAADSDPRAATASGAVYMFR